MKFTVLPLSLLLCLCLFLVVECRYGGKHRSHKPHRARYPGSWRPTKNYRDDVSADENNSTSYRPDPSSPVVHTDWATIEGTIETHSGVNVSTFYGIPFAEAPIGKLRFRLPVRKEGRYQGIYNATSPKPACVHSAANDHTNFKEETSEDCLFLNIWVPQGNDYESDNRWSRNYGRRSSRRNANAMSRQRGPSSRKLPVIFYIYGSQFKKYSASYPANRGGVTAAQGNLIFVNANHRLGSLGFAYGNDRHMPGNQAVHDLIMAIEWVRNNIGAFGGDPDRITLSGSSSGAILGGILAISPYVNPFLFDQVLLMSAVPIRPTSIESRSVALNKTKALASKLGCGEFPNEHFKLSIEDIECLQNLNASEIAEADVAEDLTLMGSCPDFAFMPIYGDEVMPSPPDVYLSKGQVRRHMKFMVGSDKHDDVESGNYEPASRAEAEEYLDNILINTIKPKLNISDDLDFLYDYYFDGVFDNDTYALKERMSQLIGDTMFQCPLLLFTEKWAFTNPIHFFFNNYTSDRYLNSTEVKYQHGPVHGQANFMFLGQPFSLEELYSDQDRLVSHRMIKILSDFVHSGEISWPPVIVSKHNKVLPLEWVIDSEVDTHNVKVNPKLKICHFWAKLYNIFEH